MNSPADLSEHPVFNALLSRWRREGLRVSWPEVEEAYRQALLSDEVSGEARKQ